MFNVEIYCLYSKHEFLKALICAITSLDAEMVINMQNRGRCQFMPRNGDRLEPGVIITETRATKSSLAAGCDRANI